MQRRKQLHQGPSAGQEILQRERGDILRQYIELDDAILHGQGSPRILETARTLLQYMLLYFAHEEQFRSDSSFPLGEDQRRIWKQNLAELLRIEAGLKQEEIYAALRMRSLCRSWMQSHAPSSQAGIEAAPPPATEERERVRA
jgi:hemerythrin